MNTLIGVLDLTSGAASHRPTTTLTLDVPKQYRLCVVDPTPRGVH